MKRFIFSNCILSLLAMLFSTFAIVSCDNNLSIGEEYTCNFTQSGGTRSISLSDDTEWTGFFNLKINGIETSFDAKGVEVKYSTINGKQYVTSIKTDWFYIEKESNERIVYSVEKSDNSRYFTIEIMYKGESTEIYISQNIASDGRGVAPAFPKEVIFGLEGGTQAVVSNNKVPNWYFEFMFYDDIQVGFQDAQKFADMFPEKSWLKAIHYTLEDIKKAFSVINVEGDWFSFEKINDYSIKISVAPSDSPREFTICIHLENTYREIKVIQK
ncbi:MAG: hypothetical protein HUJ68_07860 [Clostridia bacterium]|nr:hypothetical protein [Clostridia bacterium]